MILFSCPKKFSGDDARLQRNSIENWKRVGLVPHLAGPAGDIESVPNDLGVSVSVVESENDRSKLPNFLDLLNSRAGGDSSIQGYANADIIFPDVFKYLRSDGVETFLADNRLPAKFLIIGSRWDFQDGQEYFDQTSDETVESVAAFVSESVKVDHLSLNGPDAIDFFIFPQGLFDELKPLIVGRGGYDNALIAYCLRRRIPVIDVSRSWPILHQFHGYEHKKGGKKEVYLGSEAMMNRTIHDIVRSPPNSLDSDMILENGVLSQARWRCGFFRRLELTLRYRFNAKFVSYLFRGLQRLSGEKKRIQRREMIRTYQCVEKIAKK